MRQTGCAAAGIFIDFNIPCFVVSQNFTVPSLLPDTTILESGEMSSAVISELWPLKVFIHWRYLMSQILTFVSTAPDNIKFVAVFRST